MTRTLGAILAGLLALQAALPSAGLEAPWSTVAPLAVTVAVAALSFWVRGAPAKPPEGGDAT